MSTPHVKIRQEEARLYKELRGILEDVPEGRERERVMGRMIRQLKFAKWCRERLNPIRNSWSSAKPGKLWIWIATGALAPVVFFCAFIWVSLWVE